MVTATDAYVRLPEGGRNSLQHVPLYLKRYRGVFALRDNVRLRIALWRRICYNSVVVNKQQRFLGGEAVKKVLSFLLVLIMVLSCSACAQTGDASGASAAPALKDDAFPVTVTDQAGRTVVIEEKPQRLVSCYYITTSLLMALGVGENIVGIEDNPDYRPIYALSAPHLLDLPWVGTAKVLDVEVCAALEPNLVILPMRLKESAEILETLGVDVLLVNPESQVLLTEMIGLVGAATGTTETAESLIRFLEEKRAYLQGVLSDVEVPGVYLAGNSGVLQTAGNAMYQSDMIRLAGGRNAAAEIRDAYWAEISYEQLLTWNPEYIILASNATYTVGDVLTDPNLSGCTAVINQNVYQIPADAEAWDSPVPGSILGAFWLAGVLHPDVLTDTDCAAIMDDYYETFYHFTYSEIEK